MLANSGLGGSLSFLAKSEDVGHLMQLDRDFRGRVEKLIGALYDRSCSLISAHREEVEAIATALVDRKFLRTAEVESIMRGGAAMAA